MFQKIIKAEANNAVYGVPVVPVILGGVYGVIKTILTCKTGNVPIPILDVLVEGSIIFISAVSAGAAAYIYMYVSYFLKNRNLKFE